MVTKSKPIESATVSVDSENGALKFSIVIDKTTYNVTQYFNDDDEWGSITINNDVNMVYDWHILSDEDVSVMLYGTSIISNADVDVADETVCVIDNETVCVIEGGVMDTSIENTLSQREKTYGEYIDNSRISQQLKTVMRETPSWEKLSYDKKETLEMVAHKIARILNGNPEYKDSWHDIIGYVKLVDDTLTEQCD